MYQPPLSSILQTPCMVQYTSTAAGWRRYWFARDQLWCCKLLICRCCIIPAACCLIYPAADTEDMFTAYEQPCALAMELGSFTYIATHVFTRFFTISLNCSPCLHVCGRGSLGLLHLLASTTHLAHSVLHSCCRAAPANTLFGDWLPTHQHSGLQAGRSREYSR